MSLTEHNKKCLLVVLSFLISTVISITGYEMFKTIQYNNWKENFDNYGWLKKVTVPAKNTKLMWEYKPYGKNGDMQMNRYGFREFDYATTKKPSSVYRVAFIGDSVTLGFNVKENETFVRVFDTLVNKIGEKPNITVQSMNFGVDGYNTNQIFEMLKDKVIKFSPDLVTYVMCMNDFDLLGEDDATGEKGKYFKKPKSFFYLKLMELRKKIFNYNYHQYHYNKNKKTVLKTIENMHELLSNRNIQFCLVIVPIFDLQQTSFDNYSLENIHLDLLKELKELKIDTIDLLSIFKQSKEPQKALALDIWHPSPEGHRLIASSLAKDLGRRINAKPK